MDPNELNSNDEEGTGHGTDAALTSQSAWNALRSGCRKSAFLPYKSSVTVLTNLQRGNTEAKTPVIETEELNFHQRAAQGDLSIKDIEQGDVSFLRTAVGIYNVQQINNLTYWQQQTPQSGWPLGPEQTTKISNIDMFDEDGLTPLMWACAYGQFPTVAALLQSSAKVDLENSFGQTALLFASFGGYHEIVRILLINGANVNHKDECGNTALMYAAQGNNPHTTNELLSKNANFTAVNDNGDTAYSIAIKTENYVVQQVIENHMINLLANEA